MRRHPAPLRPAALQSVVVVMLASVVLAACAGVADRTDDAGQSVQGRTPPAAAEATAPASDEHAEPTGSAPAPPPTGTPPADPSPGPDHDHDHDQHEALVDHYGASEEARPLPDGVSRPAWLHTRPLEVDADGDALPAPTPDELVVRRIPTIDLLPPPSIGAPFAATVQPVPDDVLARSTWTPECPVTAEELAHVQVSFWGFDGYPHTGEMLVNAAWADEVVDVFRQLHDARFPIEEMRIVSAEELEGVPTGDTNNTTAFVCRPIRGSTSWSQHAYGLAVDINPFHNPYQKGDRILPELAGAYLDRTFERPGMMFEGDTAVSAFDALGWGWGGRWTSLIDWMHFSANGR